MKFKLLQFWKRHPKARLSLYSIDDTLDSSKNELRNAVSALAEMGVLVARRNSNGLITYALSDQENQEYNVELAKLACSN
jgi:hypothetical protein